MTLREIGALRTLLGATLVTARWDGGAVELTFHGIPPSAPDIVSPVAQAVLEAFGFSDYFAQSNGRDFTSICVKVL